MKTLITSLTLALLTTMPFSAHAEPYTGRLLEVYFGIKIPAEAPSVTIGYSQTASVPMQSISFQYKKKMGSQEITEQVTSMCHSYYQAIAKGRKSFPREYYGSVIVGVYNYVDGKFDGMVQLDIFDRQGDPFENASPFPKMNDCIEKLTTSIEKLSVLL